MRLIHADGSDEEGALTYAINNYRWFQQAAERLRLAGDPVPPELLRADADAGLHRQRPPGPTAVSRRSATPAPSR